MIEWKEYMLVEITEPIKETYIPNDMDNLNYIGLEHIEQETLRLNAIGSSNDVTSTKFLFKANDILFGKLRVYFRKVAKPKFNGICSTDIWVFRAKKGFDQNFLFYFLANWDFINTADGGEGGTRMPRADWNFLKSTKWAVPNIIEQKTIASILSSLDDKIELLHRQNKTLEAMAETLFRQWFIEKADESWEWKQLGEYVEVMRGLSYKGDGLTIEGNGVPMHNLNSVYEGGGYKYEGIKFYSGDFKERHRVNPGDVIVTNTEQGHDMLLIGFPAIVPKYFGDNGIFSQHIYRIQIKGDALTEPFLYYLLMTYDVREQIIGATNGSTVNMLAKDGIEWAQFRLPPKNLVKDFTELVEPMLDKKEVNFESIKSLEKLRDILLPKLMSGEVRVKN